jgi:Immunity protein Imm1
MEPTLHGMYSVEEAIAAFDATSAAELLCDRQFVILPTAVLCMATVGDPATRPNLSNPSHVVWRPARIDYAPIDDVPWLPSKVREVRGADRRKIREHHVFLRLPSDESFFYAGKAHLGSYGGPRSGGTPWQRTADFRLNEKVPRSEWLRLGGYPGWLIEINHRDERVDNGDLGALRRLTAELPRQEFSHLSMTRYEEDSLTLHTNARRGWLMYLRDPKDGGLYTSDPAYTGDRRAREMFRCVCGIELDFPADQTLPRVLAIRLVEEFFASGSLPQSTSWQPE